MTLPENMTSLHLHAYTGENTYECAAVVRPEGVTEEWRHFNDEGDLIATSGERCYGWNDDCACELVLVVRIEEGGTP